MDDGNREEDCAGDEETPRPGFEADDHVCNPSAEHPYREDDQRKACTHAELLQVHRSSTLSVTPLVSARAFVSTELINELMRRAKQVSAMT